MPKRTVIGNRHVHWSRADKRVARFRHNCSLHETPELTKEHISRRRRRQRGRCQCQLKEESRINILKLLSETIIIIIITTTMIMIIIIINRKQTTIPVEEVPGYEHKTGQFPTIEGNKCVLMKISCGRSRC